MNTAWMIRNDGKVFPYVQHIYANPENIAETLLAAEWLYANTRHEESQQLALETMAAWIASVSVDSDVISPDCPLPQEFVKVHAEKIKAIPTEKLRLNALCSEVVAELNQEFLLARYGGMCHTEEQTKEIFFRISSTGFEWYNIIHDFVTAADFPIEFIIIVRDEENTGAESIRLPTEAFLSERPIQFEPPRKLKGVMAREVFAHLSNGSALRHISWDLAIDASDLDNLLKVFRAENQMLR